MALHRTVRRPQPVARWRSWSRARRVAVAGGALLVAAALVAAALTLIRAPIGGEVEVRPVDPEVIWDLGGTSPAVTPVGGDDHSCGVSFDDGTLVLSVGNAAAGDGCQVSNARVKLDGDTNRAWLVQGIEFNGFTDEVLPEAVCGLQLVDTGFKPIGFTVTVNDTAEVGTHPAAADAGLLVVNDDDYDDDACPR